MLSAAGTTLPSRTTTAALMLLTLPTLGAPTAATGNRSGTTIAMARKTVILMAIPYLPKSTNKLEYLHLNEEPLRPQVAKSDLLW
jgi:hypothetical protein